MKIWRYSIPFEQSPNPRTPAGEIEGALVWCADGVGCIQPWPSLGDAPLEEHLAAMRAGAPTEMGRACLRCCEIDGAARRGERSLFEGLSLPPSHVLVLSGSADELRAARAVGVAKVKGDAEFDIDPSVELRIDFNGALDEVSFLKWADRLGDAKRRQIEFVEDPVPYDAEIWERLSRRTGIPLALDRGPADAARGFSVRVWKPACVADPPTGERFCITHNMDHEIGRRYAAYRAAAFDGELVACGLGEFEQLGGTGLGYDDQLEKLEWEQI